MEYRRVYLFYGYPRILPVMIKNKICPCFCQMGGITCDSHKSDSIPASFKVFLGWGGGLIALSCVRRFVVNIQLPMPEVFCNIIKSSIHNWTHEIDSIIIDNNCMVVFSAMRTESKNSIPKWCNLKFMYNIKLQKSHIWNCSNLFCINRADRCAIFAWYEKYRTCIYLLIF